MYNFFKEYSNRPSKKERNKINICIFYKDRVPFDLRLVAAFETIAKNYPKYTFYIVYPEDYNDFKRDISQNIVYFDYIILQRDYFDFNIAKTLLNKSKVLDFKIIYEIDDDLIHMDESNPGHNYYMGIKEDLETIIAGSDIVTVTTENLKNQLSYLNKNICIVKNRLIDSWFEYDNAVAVSKNTVKIGYMGSVYHSWDLILIEEAIKNVKEYFSKKNISIVFELVGGTGEFLDYAEQIEVPQECQEYFKFVEWFKNIVDWDIAIAPLEQSNINFSKSELKYLEYAALGIPGIYSNVGPYCQCISDEENGVLVFDNSPQSWQEAIIRLIEDIGLQNKIKENSLNDVKTNYRLKQSVDEWQNLFENNIKKSNGFKSIFKRFRL